MSDVSLCHICERELKPADTVLIDFSSSSQIAYFCSTACRNKFRDKRAVEQIIDLMLERIRQRQNWQRTLDLMLKHM